MRGTWKAAALLVALSLGGCVAYPAGPDTYIYAPAYDYYPGYGYYGPAYVSGSFYYYDGPHRYWGPPPHYRGPYRGPYRHFYGPPSRGSWHGTDFSGHRHPYR